MWDIGFGPWFVAALGVFLFSAALMIERGPAPASLKEPRLKSVTAKFFLLLFGAAWALFGMVQLFTAYQLSRAAANPSIVEGPVRNLHRSTNSKGVSTESFCVDTQCFSYGEYDFSVAFNASDSRGILREGGYVRIGYVGNEIVRLEVAR
jgi:hypothetical protein